MLARGRVHPITTGSFAHAGPQCKRRRDCGFPFLNDDRQMARKLLQKSALPQSHFFTYAVQHSGTVVPLLDRHLPEETSGSTLPIRGPVRAVGSVVVRDGSCGAGHAEDAPAQEGLRDGEV